MLNVYTSFFNHLVVVLYILCAFSSNILHQFFPAGLRYSVVTVSFLHLEGSVTCCVVKQHILSTISLLQIAMHTIYIAILYGATAVEQRYLSHIVIQELCSLSNVLQCPSANRLLQPPVSCYQQVTNSLLSTFFSHNTSLWCQVYHIQKMFRSVTQTIYTALLRVTGWFLPLNRTD